LQLINQAAAPLAFDLFDDSEATREVIRNILTFLRFHLRARAVRLTFTRTPHRSRRVAVLSSSDLALARSRFASSLDKHHGALHQLFAR
jgi:hypothetical protein